MQVQLVATERLWFGPGDPVRAASAVSPFGDGWLLAQDDANYAAWWRPTIDGVERIRLFPPHGGLDVFGVEEGTKHLKPDLEASVRVLTGESDTVVLLGSGSLPPRTRGVIVEVGRDGPQARWRELSPLYELARAALGVNAAALNLEGACVVGDRLRWFQRGHGAAGVASASVDLPVRDVIAAIEGHLDPGTIEVDEPRRYDLGAVGGLPLAITDAVTLPDGRICVSATAEDAPDAVADGPVLGSALALIGTSPADVEVLALPSPIAACKIEGLALMGDQAADVRVLAVVDDDDPNIASPAFSLALARRDRS
jgi:hypothetical protein